MKNVIGISAAALVAGLMLLGSKAYGADKVVGNADSGAVHVNHHMRAGTIDGMKVRNAANEDLGTVKDLVVDLNSGKITYAAVSYGGFLGLGDKLFAVPWRAFKFHVNGKDHYLVIDVDKDRLKNAPGFDKNHWPEMGDPTWSNDIDKFYGSHAAGATTTTKTTR